MDQKFIEFLMNQLCEKLDLLESADSEFEINTHVTDAKTYLEELRGLVIINGQ